jgi:hypothetical protein
MCPIQVTLAPGRAGPERVVRHPFKPGPLGEEQVVRWADRHRQRTGSWNYASSAIADAPGETWAGIDSARHFAAASPVDRDPH